MESWYRRSLKLKKSLREITLGDLEAEFNEHAGIVLTEEQQERIDKLLRESDSIAAVVSRNWNRRFHAAAR